MNSREKGKRGEREWAELLRAHHVEARRGVQYRGGPDSPDVLTSPEHPYHYEVKRTQRLNIGIAMTQAIEECGGKIPVVAHRRNRGEWLVTLRATDFLSHVLEGEHIEDAGADAPSL